MRKTKIICTIGPASQSPEMIRKMIEAVLSQTVSKFTANGDSYNWDMRALYEELSNIFGELSQDILSFDEFTLDRLTSESLSEHLLPLIMEKYAEKENLFGENMREVERVILLRVVDAKWMDHIDNMEQLRQGINLRAYGQHNPVTEYRIEASNMFDDMIARIQENTAKNAIAVRIRRENEPKREAVAKVTGESAGGDKTVKKMPVKKAKKPGRNDPCPCGSGKKYKFCCGKDE